jgi:hypothetical protein
MLDSQNMSGGTDLVSFSSSLNFSTESQMDDS